MLDNENVFSYYLSKQTCLLAGRSLEADDGRKRREGVVVGEVPNATRDGV